MSTCRDTGTLLALTVAVGGLGADSHSVGLHILVRGLEAAGLRVLNLGTQNDLARFLAVAGRCDAVLISNMDGHARLYLGEDALPGDCLWYLGGHPVVDGDESTFAGAGFRRVYRQFVEVDEVVADLRADLGGRTLKPTPPATAAVPLPPRRVDAEVHGRDAVLGSWATGEAARDIEANAELLATRPSLARAQAGSEILLHPRSGVRGVAEQQVLFDRLASGGARVLSFQVDSLTRDGRFADVAAALRGNGQLNGFPVVNHGVEALRRLTAGTDRPVQTRHSARDPRLLAEISYAGGVTAFEGGAICYNIPYYAELPLRVSLERWRYVDQMTAQYAELGVVLDREFFGTLTATLLPPAVPLVTNVLEAMLAVAEGVRSVSPAYAEQGCRVQDVAAVRVLDRLTREFAGRGGTVQVSTVFHQYMGAFPRDEADAARLIEESARTAKLCGVSRVVVKTPCEAMRIPAAEDNMHGLAFAARGLTRPPAPLDATAVTEEEDRIERTARGILATVLDLHPGDLGRCVREAFLRGHLDVPFAPSAENAGLALTARDRTGAVRFLEAGRIPLPADVLAYDTAAMDERLAGAGLRRANAWRLVVDDVLRNTREGRGWPLDAPADRSTSAVLRREGLRELVG